MNQSNRLERYQYYCQAFNESEEERRELAVLTKGEYRKKQPVSFITYYSMGYGR